MSKYYHCHFDSPLSGGTCELTAEEFALVGGAGAFRVPLKRG